MGRAVKFSSKMDEEVLEELRAYAEESQRTLSSLLSEAVSEYLARGRVRPAFRDALEEVMEDHHELLEKLAR